MKFFFKIFYRSPKTIIFSTILGILAGFIYSLLIPLVTSSLDNFEGTVKHHEVSYYKILGLSVSNPKFAATFVCMCIFVLLAKTSARALLARVATRAASDIRQELYQKISMTPISDMDRIGANRVHTVLTDDVARVVSSAQRVPDLITAVVSLISMLLYIAYLNTQAFQIIIKALLVGALTYGVLLRYTYKEASRPRAAIDGLYDAIRGLVRGAKELKLNAIKRNMYLNLTLKEREDEFRRSYNRLVSISAAAENYGDLLAFFTIGYIAFAFTSDHLISKQDLILLIMVLLYITAPAAMIFSAANQFSSANVSMSRIKWLMYDLPSEILSEGIENVPRWNEIHLSNLVFSYDAVGGYSVGPINLTIRKGELIFIVGGNGSGKSTLGKILALHYHHDGGDFRFGDTFLLDSNRDDFRRQISAIFPDYYLFDNLPAIFNRGNYSIAKNLLTEFGLSPAVDIKADGAFSTLDLSEGQKKRLALLMALMEDKSLYIFDEWAAEQDPEFREYFYTTILARLRSQNKSVIVISHDDRYFHLADRVFRMKKGLIFEV
ncbi:cyclic peptide export ABC transporter [Massilia phyllosphaerae]|uniref:cyclic peptide export ABC transporter n=1 Tax=Massilia phyllosphaerae TaxID=3106034 RepID=UPI002B1CB96F|nr:cyclic peptide export ABC transporter [Massilia sp. SGZ-792]